MKIFNRYVSLYFLKIILITFAVICLIIFFADLIEQYRRRADIPGATLGLVVLITLFRVPLILEDTIPFIVLIGSMIAFLNLNRRQELTVARSLGLSIWKILIIPLSVSFSLGVISIIVLNPASVYLDLKASEIHANLLGRNNKITSSRNNVWLRQNMEETDAIIQAAHASAYGRRLSQVTIYIFDKDFNLINTLASKEALLKKGYWQLSDVEEMPVNKPVRQHVSYQLATPLTLAHIENSLKNPSNHSFWHLPGQIFIAKAAGLPTQRHEVELHKLLATPFLFCAAVLIASTVSLRNFRFGGVGMQILYGILAGFSLFIIGKISEDLGNAGMVHSLLAGWFAPLTAIVLSLTVLLHIEDG